MIYDIYMMSNDVFEMFDHSLGCGIGYGYLHRIPVHSTVPMETPEPPAPEDPSSPATVTHGFTEVQNALSDEHRAHKTTRSR